LDGTESCGVKSCGNTQREIEGNNLASQGKIDSRDKGMDKNDLEASKRIRGRRESETRRKD